MTDGNEFKLPIGERQIERKMMRCGKCSAWWTLALGEDPHCPCGGKLVAVDMEKHMRSLPYVPIKEEK